MSAPNMLRTRLLGLAATLGLLAYVAGVPLLLIAIDAVPRPSDLAWSRLSAPDDGTVILAIIAIVAWVAWAIFAISVVLAIASRVRGLRAPRLPGLAVPQLAADQIVGAAALLFVAIPSLAAVVPAPRPAAAATAPAAPPPDQALRVAAPVAAAPAAPTPHAAEPETPATEAYTVKRGDSLWKIAETRLDDGARYSELVDLNLSVLNGEPDFLLPGTVLRVPVASGPGTADSYMVEPGDTLSEIAEDQLGDADAYPRIFDASRDRLQPDGARLIDPDLIRPGWTLTIPGAASPGRDVETPIVPQQREPGPPSAAPSVAPAAPTPTSTPPPTSLGHEADATSVDVADDDFAPGWLVPGLTGAGAVLAGSLFLALRQHQRSKYRYRRPGHVIAAPPPELRSVEKTVYASGSTIASRIGGLDRALRHLAATAAGGPRVLTVHLDRERIRMHCVEPTTLPPPWTGSGTDWTCDLGSVPDGEPSQVAPYPLLVCVGRASDGGHVLLNLEEPRTVAVTGDPKQAAALGRYLAAELALNPWSSLVEIDALGLAADLATIDPLRFHHHAAGDSAFLERLGTDLHDEDASVDPDQYRAILAAPDTADTATADEIANLAKIVTSYAGRPGAAIVTIGSPAGPDDLELRVGGDGRLRVNHPDLTLDIKAAGLTPTEARACATLVDVTRLLEDAPIPDAEEPQATADASGALKPELTRTRPTGPAGDSSLLPLDTATYEQTGATTADDLDRLAPVVPEAPTDTDHTDPSLDDDIATWQSPVLLAPKLVLLGPVRARTLGDAGKIAHRPGYYLELLTFLHLHPAGVTADDVANAVGVSQDKARSDISAVRWWLGKDPSTGKPFLPNARQSHEKNVLGTYTVQGILCDIDLFRRLRTRGQRRGADGIDDLIAALRLCTGAPFSDLRDPGWTWLLEGERIDQVMTCAVLDVAHIVTTHALSIGDGELARFAVAKSYEAAPYDETTNLDLAAVLHAFGRHDEAEEGLLQHVLNRRDDDLGPLDPPARTATIIRQRGWNSKSRTAG